MHTLTLRLSSASAGRSLAGLATALLLAATLLPQAGAQSGSTLPNAPQAQPQQPVTAANTPRNILHDQAAIWTSPARLRVRDLEWLAPLTLAAGTAIALDHRAMTDVVSHDASFNNAAVNTSNALIGGMLATPVALYGYGRFRQNDHAREAGILTTEAVIDSVAVEQGLKLVFWRERPYTDSARGRFFQSAAGVDSSFPSSHSTLAWAAASSIAAEYPSRWTQLFAYSAATGVSLTRVLGREHFPSDVLIGGAAGWLVGRYVVHRHHHRSVH